jgi:hypothetical protein
MHLRHADHAHHLTPLPRHSYKVCREVARDLPETISGCIEVGAAALRAHLEIVRK